MEDNRGNEQEKKVEHDQIAARVVDIRQKAFMQIIYGLLWWLGSAVAMYFALASTSDNMIYWYGGALGSLFHWYRAFKLIKATQQMGAKSLVQRELVLIGITAFVIFFTSYTIIPEYFRIDTPSVGSCWFTNPDDQMVTIACWSNDAEFKTLAMEDSEDACMTDWFIRPGGRMNQYACIEEMT